MWIQEKSAYNSKINYEINILSCIPRAVQRQREAIEAENLQIQCKSCNCYVKNTILNTLKTRSNPLSPDQMHLSMRKNKNDSHLWEESILYDHVEEN